MSGIGGVGGNFNVNDLTTFEAPSQSGFSKFGSILSAVGSAVPGAGAVGGALSALGGGGANTSFNRQYQLLQLQSKMQQEAQMINMISNINKTKHEASMAAIRNVK